MPVSSVTTHTPLEIQIHNIEKFFSFIFEPGDVIEICGLGSPTQGIMGVFTANFKLAARVAVRMSANDADVYFALNPLAPDPRRNLDYPAAHVRNGDLAGKDDIACRNTYLFDCDSIREKGTASTPAHRAAALALAQIVLADLTERGCPPPIILDSGNGCHLLFKGDRCDPSGEILADALKYLSAKYSTEGAKLDTCVHNPARISRVPFILNKKAGREASVISYPRRFEPVAAGIIYGIAVDGGLKTPFGAPRPKNGACMAEDFDVDDLIDEFPDQLIGDGVQTRGDTTFYGLAECPFAGRAHTGQNVGAGKTTIILRPDGIGFKCFSDDCTDHTFVDLLRLLFEKTGRRFSGKIWEDNIEELNKRWKGEGVTMADDGKPVWLEDGLTFADAADDDDEEYEEYEEVVTTIKEKKVIQAQAPNLYAMFEHAAHTADALIARVNPQGQAAFRKEVERIMRAKDYHRMSDALGKSLISEIHPDVWTSPSLPSFDTDFLTVTTIEDYAHEMAIALKAFTEAQWLASGPQPEPIVEDEPEVDPSQHHQRAHRACR